MTSTGHNNLFEHRVFLHINFLRGTVPFDLSLFQSFQWMSRVLQAIDSIHQVGIYCLALVPPNHLPKTPLGGIHISETRLRFLDGTLHPTNLLMCPHTSVTNLPKPREPQPGLCTYSQLHFASHPSRSTSSRSELNATLNIDWG